MPEKDGRIADIKRRKYTRRDGIITNYELQITSDEFIGEQPQISEGNSEFVICNS